ncbi:MAG: tRNA dihydrouridine(20/20a) synthase DusA [Shimia sp.]
MRPTTDTAPRISVAPMMAWTDRHCRAFHRTLSRHAVLYTEMVTSAALVRGGATRLLAFGAGEHPVVLQLGGSDPEELAEAARMGAGEGYDEIDLNVGCPSDRVQSGTFGAVLMRRPDLVARCAEAMAAAVEVPVTVKCRIGVDEQDPAEVLPAFLATIRDAGVRRVTIHARKAWLKGLSPKENREVPPLDYPLVVEMARALPELSVSINGGIGSLDQVDDLVGPAGPLAGAMIGRAAYNRPADILADVDRRYFGAAPGPSREEVVERMRPHIADHLQAGGQLHQVTRHMLGLFAGRPGARHWRRVLSEEGHGADAGLDVLDRALAQVGRAAA